MQYEGLLSTTDMNHSEIHLQSIMNGRINSDSAYVVVNENKKPAISIGAWKDTISKNVKIMEGLICQEVIDVKLLLGHIIQISRK
jgi:hypothetical protein